MKLNRNLPFSTGDVVEVINGTQHLPAGSRHTVALCVQHIVVSGGDWTMTDEGGEEVFLSEESDPRFLRYETPVVFLAVRPGRGATPWSASRFRLVSRANQAGAPAPAPAPAPAANVVPAVHPAPNQPAAPAQHQLSEARVREIIGAAVTPLIRDAVNGVKSTIATAVTAAVAGQDFANVMRAAQVAERGIRMVTTALANALKN